MAVYYISMAALIVGAYLFGNINVSVIISRIKNRDVRKLGSGNPGTMNMLRSFGVKLGALTLVLDAVKGAVPAVIGWWLLGQDETFSFGADKIGLYIGGISVVIGHIFPVFFKFKGGKGVAASIGVCFVANPLVSLAAFGIGLVFFFTVKIGSLTSMIMTGIPLVYCGVTALIGGRITEGTLALCIYAILLIAHRSNFVRIFTGKEKQIILFGKNKSSKNTENTLDASEIRQDKITDEKTEGNEQNVSTDSPPDEKNE